MRGTPASALQERALLMSAGATGKAPNNAKRRRDAEMHRMEAPLHIYAETGGFTK
ncbi:putative small protein [Xanthomonas campestris pv. campestris]|uniref:Small protein n=1 Tax=Xanthomonas campestris pv. campestris (strain B100) TaxID=509169 RepID=B0RZ48_XANCB|nr:putative small protein [Xanthomonas campestris pv. campestris]